MYVNKSVIAPAARMDTHPSDDKVSWAMTLGSVKIITPIFIEVTVIMISFMPNSLSAYSKVLIALLRLLLFPWRIPNLVKLIG